MDFLFNWREIVAVIYMLDKIKREIVKPVIIQKLKIISGELKLEKTE